MLTPLKRIIKFGWQNLTRNGGSVTATCFIMVLTISLATSLFLLDLSSKFVISKIEEKADISVYFKSDVQEEEILKVKDEISKFSSEVKSIEYVSKETALDQFTKRYEENPLIVESLKALGFNPLLASLNIRAADPGNYEKIASFLETSSFSDLIDHQNYLKTKGVIERIFSLTSRTNQAGFILSIIVAILAVLVTFNTIRLAIYNRREEISIQRLVGASNWFIRGPFIVQGIFAGIFSAIISLLITVGVCYFLSPKIEILFSGLNVWRYLISNFFTIILIQLITGIGLGIISSAIAVRKYLKV